MIQRIQTIFLLFAAILNTVSLFVPFWKFANGTQYEIIKGMEITGSGSTTIAAQSFMAWDFAPTPLLAVFSGICIITSIWILADIFLFNNRKRQMTFAYFGVVLLMIELVLMVLITLNGPYIITSTLDEGLVQFGLVFPVLALVLLWLAIRRINHDEQLVRSVDRIR